MRTLRIGTMAQWLVLAFTYDLFQFDIPSYLNRFHMRGVLGAIIWLDICLRAKTDYEIGVAARRAIARRPTSFESDEGMFLVWADRDY